MESIILSPELECGLPVIIAVIVALILVPFIWYRKGEMVFVAHMVLSATFSFRAGHAYPLYWVLTLAHIFLALAVSRSPKNLDPTPASSS